MSHGFGNGEVSHRAGDHTTGAHSVYGGANDVEKVVPKNSERGQVLT
jgi:hypothetical protein